MENNTVKELIQKMTLDEKIGLCVGKDFWHTQGVDRLEIPSTVLTDGPHGLRKQAGAGDQLGLGESVKAICFPAGCALASSFDPGITEMVGTELGKLAKAENVGVVLGPAMNVKRSPLCGRNFEYYSEDPLVSGKMASGAVDGIQSNGTGACLKHFVANNQEYYRQTQNSVVDEQTMREIYLPAFEMAVKESDPKWVMSAYNRINGTYASENKEYLTNILREEWGFDGAVVSDWGACNDPVESLKAGMDLCMPGPAPDNVEQLKCAVENGNLSEEVVDRAVYRILKGILTDSENTKETVTYDFSNGHEVAKKIETECAVLLKNDDDILPLKKSQKVLFIGEYVKNPRYQGGGSSHINAWKVSSLWDEISEWENVSFAQGYCDDEKKNDDLIKQAKELAAKADKVVIFAGLPDDYETEAVDRKHLDLPEIQNRLIEEVSKIQPDTIVVLHNGSPVAMPWLESVKGVLELYLGGEAVGSAAADLLYGNVNPSGRLAETFPLRVEDTPVYPYYGVEKDDVIYREGRLVGYRYYETMKRNVLFPFGYGLSYTTFSYSDLKTDRDEMTDEETVTVRVDITNTGKRAGKEVVQLYVSNPILNSVRPIRELRAFEKVSLNPGETKTVEFVLGKRAFAEWNTSMKDWCVPTGEYKIQIGVSAQEIVLEKEIKIVSEHMPTPVYTINTPLGDMFANPVAKELVLQAMHDMLGERASRLDSDDVSDESGALSKEAMLASAASMPLRSLLSFGAETKREQLEDIVDKINKAVKK